MESPNHLDKVCQKMSSQFSKDSVDIVLGAAIGGILLSSGVAKYLGKRVYLQSEYKKKWNLEGALKYKKVVMF